MSHATAPTLEVLMSQLAAIAGPEHTHRSEESIAVAPADAQQIATILRFAREHSLAVAPSGSGTKMSWGNPVAPRIQLLMNRMNALREHSWQDMTCGVEAGCTWAAMQAQLARHGQMVALDPLWPVRATIGGIVATNDGGALRLRYGGLRDLIIGMTVVLADGTIAKTGGKVVKNVAGYDLHKLMTGSFGTLGVIADVNFRLHPVEAQSRTWTAQAPDPSHFEAPLRTLLDSQIIPSGMQIRIDPEQCALDVREAATPTCLDDHAALLTRFFGPIPVHESSEAVWQARQNLFDSAGATVLKASLLPSQLCSVLSHLRQSARADSTEIAAAAQCNGLVNIALRAAPDASISLIERLRYELRASSGSVVVLQLPAELRGRIDVWECDSNALPLMREIKRRFDPDRILNPGRFAGNI
jgi:glycolate oxidase FAD binding subunit